MSKKDKSSQQQKLVMPDICFSDKWLGAIPFETSLKEQDALKNEASAGKFCFLGFEAKYPAITKGVRSNSEDILWSNDQLKNHQIEIIELRRGGQATLHAPGQLVIYPVIHLPLFKIKVKDFLMDLETITQSFLEDLDIKTKSLEKDAGLSTLTGKIAFFGIHISTGVSQHGLSINVNNNLELFSSIKSCGTAHRPHDSLSLHQINFTTKQLFYKWTKKAQSVWKFRTNNRSPQSIGEVCE